MNLGELILALKPLLADPKANGAKIVELLDHHQSLAEFEVARFYVGKAVAPELVRAARSADPAERLRAARGASSVLKKDGAAAVLRRLVKDPDCVVRGAAQKSVNKLGLDDVSPPDFRYATPRVPHRSARGAWNPSGWSFGLTKGRGARAQLQKTGSGGGAKPKLPAFQGLDDLLETLAIPSRAELAALLRPGEGPGSPYVSFTIPKATGGRRPILAPRKKLKLVQRTILDQILSKVPLATACHGFARARSVASNAQPHVKAAVVLKLDLVDFFPTIHFRRVEGMFAYYGYSPEVASTLAGLVTHRPLGQDGKPTWPGVLPQGAPTSPAIANIVCRRLDARLAQLATKYGAKYTRYADDMTFSFAQKPTVTIGRFLWWVDAICQQEGFTENTQKRRVLRPHAQQRITGVVVNDKPTVPRRERRKFRALLHACKTKGIASIEAERPGLRAEMKGFAAYVKMVQPELGEELVREVKTLLAEAP